MKNGAKVTQVTNEVLADEVRRILARKEANGALGFETTAGRIESHFDDLFTTYNETGELAPGLFSPTETVLIEFVCDSFLGLPGQVEHRFKTLPIVYESPDRVVNKIPPRKRGIERYPTDPQRDHPYFAEGNPDNDGSRGSDLGRYAMDHPHQ